MLGRERARWLTKCLFPPLCCTLSLCFLLRPGQDDQVVIGFDKQNFAAHLGMVWGHIAGTPCRREVGGWSSNPFSYLNPILEECSCHVPWFEPQRCSCSAFSLLSPVPTLPQAISHLPLSLLGVGSGKHLAHGCSLRNKINPH